MRWSWMYLLTRGALQLVVLRRGDTAKDVELLVLGYEVVVLRRQVNRPALEPADGALTTDADGNGNANVQEAALPGASSAWVDLNNQANFAEFLDTRVVTF